MSDPMLAIARGLTRIPGVMGAIIVDAEAGVPVASEVAAGVPETALSALSASLLKRTSEAARGSALGPARIVQLEAEEENIIIADAGPLLVVVLAGTLAQLGLVRVQVARAAEELSR